MPTFIKTGFWEKLSRAPKEYLNLDNLIQSIAGGGGTPYKKYVALLSQSGTDAPVATVLENTLGGTPVWTRDSIGNYKATLEGAFPDGKTVCFYTHDGFDGTTGYGGLKRNDSNTVWMTFNGSDGAYADSQGLPDSIEIRVYP